MKVDVFSYRYAREILEHPNNREAWDEIISVVEQAPLFVYANKSAKNPRLDVVQQLMNTYFDRRLVVDLDWGYHPLATKITESGLRADFRKEFANLTVQAEVQFGNMSRWYSDIFKFQTAYSQSLIQVGLCIVPKASLAGRIDSNVVNFERAVRELPSAELSITLPILMLGMEHDAHTQVVDVARCQFESIRTITGRGNELNRWRIVNGFLNETPMESIGPESPAGRILVSDSTTSEDEE